MMNVKRQIFEKNNKENSNINLSAHQYAQTTKNKTNIGQQIRKKLKIKQNPIQPSSVLLPREDNAILERKSKFDIDRTHWLERPNYMHRSIEVDKSISRSVKSVRFDEKNENPNLSRKHSTSSILKNSRATRKPRFSDKMSMNNSICSNILRDDQSTENLTSNKISKQKYERTFEEMKRLEKKYSDELFPPVWSSICRITNPDFNQIEWMRLSQLFSGKFLTVWDYNESIKISPGQFSSNQMQANCYNSIKHNNFILQKLFESQKFNQYGIYYIKIFQNNSWKYVMVDDYVPVYKDSKKFVPAFLKVQNSNPNHLSIWPFLLQKAYAKCYSNYECLDLGNQVEFLQQITGCYPEEMNTTSASDFEQISYEANNFDSILIAKCYNGEYFPIVPHKANLTCQDPKGGYIEKSFTNEQFKDCFQKVYCILLHKFFYSGFCTIRYNHKSEANNQMSLRCVNIEQSSQCVFSLVQKDSKYYYRGDYKYTWVRMIVVMKESDKNYRWIAGTYRNTKYANLSLWLEPAEYIVIIIPEWRNKGYDLNLTFQGNLKVKIDRKPYYGNENILIEAAMDLAQSKGKLKQLNPSICTYSYIQPAIGFIIENINNERPTGIVRIFRSIEGLQQCGQNLIKAFNMEFRGNQTIEVKIESLQHFTVVLGVLGGINKAFLDQFDFGS